MSAGAAGHRVRGVHGVHRAPCAAAGGAGVRARRDDARRPRPVRRRAPAQARASAGEARDAEWGEGTFRRSWRDASSIGARQPVGGVWAAEAGANAVEMAAGGRRARDAIEAGNGRAGPPASLRIASIAHSPFTAIARSRAAGAALPGAEPRRRPVSASTSA
ncbi:hypothetical protein QMA78_24520 [Burkholderia pseudomallei]|nr:hypothetical protein [Burkholderia pseudomallei]MEB5493701.1 hypothetical protein [Burkholderia pseudomallei]